MMGRNSIGLGVIAVWFAIAGPVASAQQITYTVAFDDPNQTSADLYQPIIQHIQAAGASWNAYLRPTSNIILEVRVGFPTTIPEATGRSLAGQQIGTVDGRRLIEQGAAHEIRTGFDPNGGEADVELNFNPNYLRNQLWLDPNPFQRTATVDATKTDAMSVILHELGHALAFNGFRDTSGNLPGNDLSTFDRHVTAAGGVLYFNGPTATSLYGDRPIPLTIDEAFHLGNRAPQPGADLVSDLMNGVEFTNGTRYDISLLDVTILADSGVPVVPVPEPVLGLGIAAVGVMGWTLRRSRRLRLRATRGVL